MEKQARYEPLTRLSVSHTFFSDLKYTGFVFRPDKQTINQFNRLSLLLRPLPDGFSIYYSEDEPEQGKKKKILSAPIRLVFEIDNQYAEFMNITDSLPEDIASTFLFFENQIAVGLSSQKGVMHKNKSFSVVDILQNKAPDPKNPLDKNREFFKKPFGVLEILLHPALEDQLYIKFTAKETIWRYIINSDYLQQLIDPAVIDKETKEVFTPVNIELPDGSKRLAFQSKKPIPLQNTPKKNFQLVDHFQKDTGFFKKQVIKSLPNPDVRNISLVKTETTEISENNFSEIFI